MRRARTDEAPGIALEAQIPCRLDIPVTLPVDTGLVSTSARDLANAEQLVMAADK